MKAKYFRSFLLYLPLILLARAERIKNKIYYDISGQSACFRRLNGTHQIGCSSEPKGNVGVVHYLETEEDIKWLLEKGPDKPYAALLNDSDFNMDNVNRLKDSGKVNGIMVIHLRDKDTETLFDIPDSFSPDKTCPGDEYGMYQGTKHAGCKDVKWNPFGNNMMFQDLSFPVFILTNKTEVDFTIHDCYEKFNKPLNGNPRQHPLCAVQLKDRMDAAKDSETCVRRTRHQMNLSPNKYCDAMGDNNVYATVKVVNSTVERPEKSVVLAVTRMDSFSMFESSNASADNPVSGIVALLAAAEAIGKVKEDFQEGDKDIMFTFFQGEAFDYIGSGRMVYDMERNNFPLPKGQHLATVSLPHISSMIEVNQLAHRDNNKLWIHTDPISNNNKNISTEVDGLINLLSMISQSLNVSIDRSDKSHALPPASVQSFLKKRNISAVVITDHDEGFTNRYYNSRFDTAYEINASYPDSINKTDRYDYVTDQAKELAEVSTLLARYLYREATGRNDSNITADSLTVTHLLYCFLFTPTCELFKEILSEDDAKNLQDTPYKFYVGVDWQINEVTSLTNKLLLRYLGDSVQQKKEKKDCHQDGDNIIYQYAWMQGPIKHNETTGTSWREAKCWRAPANFSTAVSIAFEIDNYNWKSREFSTWTESSWAVDAIQIRLFLIPSKKFEVTTLIVGVLIFLLSLAGSYFLNSRAQVLFTTPDTPSSAPTIT